jgi:hypothetical protein
MIDRIENTLLNRVEYRLNGVLHNPNGPAITNIECRWWMLYGQFHRYYGPALRNWYVHGEYIK